MSAFPVVERIFCELFDVPEGSLSLAAGPQDVPGWDSVAHVKLLLMLEDAGVSLDPDEALSLHTVGDVVAAVERHRNGR